MRERLSISLTLTAGGAAHKIPGGNVRGLSLEMTSWGVEGWVEFVMQHDTGRSGPHDDALLDDFVKQDLAEVSLSVEAAHLDTVTEPAAAALKTGGVVLERQLREALYERELGEPVALSRYYRVGFADPARALWRQHFPCDLFTNKSFKDVIEAHKGAKATLSYDWDTITTAAPQIFFHLDPGAGCSFYDLVLWYVQGGQGVFTFDHAAGEYAITGVKSTSGTAAKLPGEDVASMTWVFPEVPRFKPRVVCSYTEAPRTEVINNAKASTGMFQDALMRTPIAKEVDDAVAAETARPLLPMDQLEVAFRRFPTVAMTPGSFVDISAAGGHSIARRLPAEPMRVWRLSIEARALDEGPERDYTEPATDFELSISARVEAKSDRASRLPPFTAPRFPGLLEGKVVSETGPATDITYQIYPNQQTSVEYYEVKIPLFANQIVTTPYEPYTGAGTLYLPLYKEERVLVALDFHRASIRQLLDWRADARVPEAGQGQHLFLGKSAKSNTSVLHDYESDKPVYRILRTNDKDTLLLRMEEGKLTLKVEETT